MERYHGSDFHFGHLKICEYTGRPYHSVGEMDADLLARINSVVRPNDIFWIHGDVAMGSIEESLAMVKLIHSRKFLVPGNHDRCWRGDKRYPKWLKRYLEEGGFEAIVDAPHEISIGHHRVRLTHFPYRGDSQAVERYREWRPVDDGMWLLHGHAHGQWRQNGNQIDVGVDAWGGFPVHQDQILDLIAAGHNDVAPLEWNAQW